MPGITDPSWNPSADYDPEKVPYITGTAYIKDQATDEVIEQTTFDIDDADWHPEDWDTDALISVLGFDPDDYDAEKHYITWDIELVNPNADDE